MHLVIGWDVIPAQSQIERQLRSDLVIIRKIRSDRPISSSKDGERLKGNARAADGAEQEAGVGVTGAACIRRAADSCRLVGAPVERQRGSRSVVRRRILLQPLELYPKSHGMLSLDPEQVINRGIGLGDGGSGDARSSFSPFRLRVAAGKDVGGELGDSLSVGWNTAEVDAHVCRFPILDSLSDVLQRWTAKVAKPEFELVHQIRSDGVGVGKIGPVPGDDGGRSPKVGWRDDSGGRGIWNCMAIAASHSGRQGLFGRDGVVDASGVQPAIISIWLASEVVILNAGNGRSGQKGLHGLRNRGNFADGDDVGGGSGRIAGRALGCAGGLAVCITAGTVSAVRSASGQGCRVVDHVSRSTIRRKQLREVALLHQRGWDAGRRVRWSGPGVDFVVGRVEEELVVAAEEMGDADGTAHSKGEFILVVDGLSDRNGSDDAVDQFLLGGRDCGEAPGVEFGIAHKVGDGAVVFVSAGLHAVIH